MTRGVAQLSRVFLLLGWIAVVAPCACGPSAPERVELGAADAGHTIVVRAGGQLQVVLEGNPTTGFLWEVASVDAVILKPTGEPQFKADSSLVGSGGKVTLTFDALAPGKTTLQLVYRRPFEKGVPPIKTFQAEVAVQ